MRCCCLVAGLSTAAGAPRACWQMCRPTARRRGRPAAAAAGSGAGPWWAEGEEPETVTAWLLRHGADPAELDRQEPTWEGLTAALGSRQLAVELVRREPLLLAMPRERIEANLRVLREQRLAPSEVRRSLQRCPQLFLLDYASPEMQAKFRFFQEVLRRQVRHVLTNQPHLLLRSFAGIERKVAFMQHKGDASYLTTMAWLTLSDADFCWHYGLDAQEFAAWEHEPSARWQVGD